MKLEEIYMKLFDFSRPTYYKKKRELVPALSLIERYFSEKDLLEYLEKGFVSKYENNTDALLDQAIFSAKHKSITYFEQIDKLPSKQILFDILKKIDPNDSSFTVENSKSRLIDVVTGAELQRSLIKNSQKQKLLTILIEKYFSKIEVFAMIKYPKEVFDYAGFFGQTRFEK